MDDPRPLRLRPQTEEPARAHVSPPVLASPTPESVTPPASEGVFAEARAVLVRRGTRRRKLQRIQHAICLGSTAGSLTLCLAYFLYYRSRVSADWFLYAPVLMQIIPLLAPKTERASRGQKEALANLVPGAEKSDLSWLIEGTQYADMPELRLALLEKIRSFLADLTPEDAVLLPEGARKILRSWPGGVFRSEPDVAQETLRALAVIEDPKLPKLLKGIARWRPRHLGDEETIRLATVALGLPPRVFPAPPATREEAEKSIVEETELRKRWSQMETTFALFTLLIFVVQLGVALYLDKFAILWFSFGFFLSTIAIAITKAQVHTESLYREAVAERVVSRLAGGNHSASPDTPSLAGGVARGTSGGGQNVHTDG